MDRRKEAIKEYKARKLLGCVYKITNTVNGKYLIGHAANLNSVRNRFQLAVKTGGAVDPRVRKDWEELGAQAFELEILEELEQREGQTEAQFNEDLKALEQLLRANFDQSLKY
jgi:hypothetical protein